jgi:hypothetical protein
MCMQVAMFTVLRRFNIPITLFLNWLLLNRWAGQHPV